MSLLQKYNAGIIASVFWLVNAGLAVHFSRVVGYYPKGLRARAQARAYAEPYPWPEILAVWLIFALATVVVYLILRRAAYKATWLVLYSLALLAVTAVFIPADRGGAFGGMMLFPFLVLLLAWLLRVGVLLASVCGRRGKTARLR
ncbi:MAG TPA: hypothetical protein VKC56_03430 [Gallionellaceae bacterium]|nr:hypothetical protein [Gallionellaceae bacterium]